MSKLAVIVVLVYAVYFGTLKVAKAQEALEDAEDEIELRSGRFRAQAHSSASVGPNGYTRPYPQQPSSLPTLPPASTTLSLPNVECYVCTDCPIVSHNTTTKLCPKTWDGTKDRSCVAYSEKYNHMKRPWYIRGCASERGNCQDIKMAHAGHNDIVKLVTCHECVGDKCNTNGANKSLSDLTMALIALVVTPLMVKYTIT